MSRQQVSDNIENVPPEDGFERVKKSLGPETAAWLSEAPTTQHLPISVRLDDDLAPTIPDLAILDEASTVEGESNGFNPFEKAPLQKK